MEEGTLGYSGSVDPADLDPSMIDDVIDTQGKAGDGLAMLVAIGIVILGIVMAAVSTLVGMAVMAGWFWRLLTS